ncbi:MAG: prepilin-type N-terminal cleavage/methylation domain-containing protein [Deltaproteobacteria bacterium]|jgi:prepilin-type N-terminal cleavage/methylation domain-containing protein|nr:prepilin-type N-terminal cleavage/methylation domain-containing protein [Deltaproteobacteria bacterium]
MTFKNIAFPSSSTNNANTRPRPLARAGFTLIEILIAVCLIAVGALVSITMHMSSLKGESLAANMIYAAAIAETELERLKTLPFRELLGLANAEVTELDPLSQTCQPGQDCSQNIFTRRTSFFPKFPTTMSCQVEIEVKWLDSSGRHSVIYSGVITTTSLST